MPLVKGGKLLDDRYPEHTLSSFWYYMESLRCCPVMQSFLLRFFRESMFLHPCALYSEPFLSPKIDKSPETMSLCVFNVRPEAWKALNISGGSIK